MVTEKQGHSLRDGEFHQGNGKNESKDPRGRNLTTETIPQDEKDSQSKLSKDPTRKNEAQQGESDLRKRTD